MTLPSQWAKDWLKDNGMTVKIEPLDDFTGFTVRAYRITRKTTVGT